MKVQKSFYKYPKYSDIHQAFKPWQSQGIKYLDEIHQQWSSQLLQKSNLRATIELQDGHPHFNHTNKVCSEMSHDFLLNMTVNTKESSSNSGKDETTRLRECIYWRSWLKWTLHKVKNWGCTWLEFQLDTAWEQMRSARSLHPYHTTLLCSYWCECIRTGPTGQHVLWSVPVSSLTCDLNVLIRDVHQQTEGNQNIQ